VGAVGLKSATHEANPDAKRLYDDLLSNYNRLIRPVSNNSETLTVWLGLKLSQLIEVVSELLPSAKDAKFPRQFKYKLFFGAGLMMQAVCSLKHWHMAQYTTRRTSPECHL
jgi:hypothetical protein